MRGIKQVLNSVNSIIKAALSSFQFVLGDGGKSLYKYYQNMYLV
jgi:hypothetical protein